MGAWGYGPFDNDRALDLIDALREGDDSIASLVRRYADEEYLDADSGSEIIAALAILAATRGLTPADEADLTGIHVETDAQTDTALGELALTVVRTPARSELYDLYAAEETDDIREWAAEVTRLATLITPTP